MATIDLAWMELLKWTTGKQQIATKNGTRILEVKKIMIQKKNCHHKNIEIEDIRK